MTSYTGQQTNFTPRPKPHYPEDNDATIRHWASLPMIGNQDAIEALDKIKNRLFGNADKVEQLANLWSSDQTMTNDWQDINSVTTQLSGYWEGAGADQYNTYVSNNVLPVLSGNQDAMHEMGAALADCVEQVYTTYQNCISAMAICAGDLSSIAASLGLSVIPVVGEISDAYAIEKIMDTLGDFVTEVSNFIAEAKRKIGTYKKVGVAMAGAANKYLEVGAPGQRMGDPKAWHEKK